MISFLWTDERLHRGKDHVRGTRQRNDLVPEGAYPGDTELRGGAALLRCEGGEGIDQATRVVPVLSTGQVKKVALRETMTDLPLHTGHRREET